MRALKKFSLGALTVSILSIGMMGSYNSMIMSDDAFMADSSGINFTKRLDEISGKVVVGRMAASSIPWTNLNKKAERKIKKAKIAISKNKFKKAERKMKKAVKAVAQKVILPKPAINADLDLELSSVFNKKSLKAGTFSGSAKTVDGVIEEIYVSLPGGKVIDINTRERMAGNVFQYEDSETREMKSGMFYEVKKGTYMITLTNDSKFAGTRLEFKANNTEVAYNDDHYSAQESWDLDQQNKKKEEDFAKNDIQEKDFIKEESRFDEIERRNQEQFEREMQDIQFRDDEFVQNELDQIPSSTEFNFQT